MNIKYMVYFDKKFYSFDNWRETDNFIRNNPGCRFKKIQDKSDIAKFKETWDGKENFKSKTYIVINNNKVYRFNKWNECKSFVDQNPESRYKSFDNEKDAQSFINNNIHTVNNDLEDVLYCYLGTCFNKNNGKLGYSFIAVKNNKIILEDKGSLANETNIGQLRGEIEACINSINYAISIKEERIIIAYTNLAIEMFANRSWNARTKETIDFKNKFFDLQKLINIDFLNINKNKNNQKIQYYHDLAVKLANSC